MTHNQSNIIDLKIICKYTDRIYRAYEHLLSSYEEVCKENDLLKKNAKSHSSLESPITTNPLKRRKTDEDNNDSCQSNDLLNNAIQDTSSYVEDEIIESTPKPDVTKKDLSKKIVCPPRSLALNYSNDPINKIKLETSESTLVTAHVEPKTETIKHCKKSDSPLKSVENQKYVGKENQKATKWFSPSFISPSRVGRTGFISTKSPKMRLSLNKPFKQSTLDFGKKSVGAPAIDTCVETFFEGTPPKIIVPEKTKFLRQQCLENCTSSSQDLDDDNLFAFKSKLNPPITPTKTPQKMPLNTTPNIKQEPLTGQMKKSILSQGIPDEKSQTIDASSPSSSVVALSGEKVEVIVIDESEPLFDECLSENLFEKIEQKVLPVGISVTDRSKEVVIEEHMEFCRQCKIFIESSRHLTFNQKLDMIDRCVAKNPIRPDTDPEFWNPRFLPTPESQKQETLIDDRFVTHERKF